MLLISWTFDTFSKWERSFNAKNLKSEGQRAAKLLAIKLWEWFDPGPTRTRADWFEWGRGQAANFFLRPSTLTAGNFEALSPKDPKSLSLKDLNLLKKYFKYQKTSYNFRLGFALSNRPHLHRTYLVTVYIRKFIGSFGNSTFIQPLCLFIQNKGLSSHLQPLFLLL